MGNKSEKSTIAKTVAEKAATTQAKPTEEPAKAATTETPAESKSGDTSIVVAEQAQTPAVADDADDEFDFEDAAGEGHEERDSSMVKIPRLDLLQASSGIIKMPEAARPKGLEGAKQGMFIDTVSKELFTEIEVLPVHYIKWYNVQELGPEVNGKRERTYRGRLKKDDPKVVAALAAGNFTDGFFLLDQKGIKTNLKIEECIELYVVYWSQKNGIRMAVVWLQSKKIPVFREWNSGVGSYMVQGKKKMYNPPLRAARTVLSSVYDQGDAADHSRASMLITIRPAEMVDGVPNFPASMVKKSDPRWAVAEKFYEDLMSNRVAPIDTSGIEDTGGHDTPSSGDKRKDGGF